MEPDSFSFHVFIVGAGDFGAFRPGGLVSLHDVPFMPFGGGLQAGSRQSPGERLFPFRFIRWRGRGSARQASEMKRFLWKEWGNYEGLPVSIKNGAVPERRVCLALEQSREERESMGD
ncbi:hypothetical protein CXU22_05900 [Akkermansia muciniphila]|uniref:Uncharacterized protein n=1 Tax=Akkermansia muciniphila TaxID=239935 RepID=A0A2N8HDZ0_9BACT|nr:hypothetical protein CXU22_05900 [Akkermansia muciniphila]